MNTKLKFLQIKLVRNSQLICRAQTQYKFSGKGRRGDIGHVKPAKYLKIYDLL